MAITMYTLDQLMLLMDVAGSEKPAETAAFVMRRWEKILEIANGVKEGRVLDFVPTEVVQNYKAYIAKAWEFIVVLDEWFLEHGSS